MYVYKTRYVFSNKLQHVENLQQIKTHNLLFYIGYKYESIGSVSEAAASAESATTSLYEKGYSPCITVIQDLALRYPFINGLMTISTSRSGTFRTRGTYSTYINYK